MNADWITVAAALVGAIIGGGITGFFTMRATNKAFKLQQKQANDQEKKLIHGLLRAIHDEVETVWEQYQESMGVQVEALQDGKPIEYYFPVTNDFFTVYNGNSFLIGRIPDHDLRKRIIRTYTLAKGLVNSFRLNNEFLYKREMAVKIREETEQEVHKRQADAHSKALIMYAKEIRKSHQSTKEAAKSLLRELRKQGVLNNLTD
jgi:hypothetical protein